MKIGPLRDLEYDDATRQITTESHVVIVDPDMVTSGDGMMVQLRQDDAPQPGASSGFGGAERLELLKNVDVVIHDVGKSGMMPGMKQPVRPANGAVEAKIEVAAAPGQSAKPELQQGPTPLRGDMQIQDASSSCQNPLYLSRLGPLLHQLRRSSSSTEMSLFSAGKLTASPASSCATR